MNLRVPHRSTASPRQLGKRVYTFDDAHAEFGRGPVGECGDEYAATVSSDNKQFVQNAPDQHLCLTGPWTCKNLKHAIFGPYFDNPLARTTGFERLAFYTSQHEVDEFEKRGTR